MSDSESQADSILNTDHARNQLIIEYPHLMQDVLQANRPQP